MSGGPLRCEWCEAGDPGHSAEQMEAAVGAKRHWESLDQPAEIVVTHVTAGAWRVPRLFIVLHGIGGRYGELPDLAERHGWGRVE